MESRLQAAGQSHTIMNMKIFNALDMATALPAKAGTPYETETQQGVRFGVPALAGKGMKELEGMLK